MIQIYAADDPLVVNGTYDIYGWKPGEERRVRKGREKMCEMFRCSPDVLSPDEQALVMTLLKAVGLLGRKRKDPASRGVTGKEIVR